MVHLGRPLVSACEIAVVAEAGADVEDRVEVKVGPGTCVNALEGASVEVASFVVVEVRKSPPDTGVEVAEMITMVKDPVRTRGPMVVISEVPSHTEGALLLVQ